MRKIRYRREFFETRTIQDNRVTNSHTGKLSERGHKPKGLEEVKKSLAES